MTLKVGIVGVGGIAGSHVPGWRASEDAELVAGSDLREDVLRNWGDANGVEKLYVNASDLMADPDIDIVDVCTPNMYHAPISIAALDAGKHVICEKPLAPTPTAILEMIDARERSNKLLMTAQHFRFEGSSKALKAEIDAGSLGEVYHSRAWMLRRAGAPIGPGFVMKEHSGGGPCIDIGVHILDLALWLMGNPEPVAVTGVARNELARRGAFSSWARQPLPAAADVEEFAAAFVRFDNGATLILEVSWMLHHDTEGEDMQMWLYGTEGGSHWPSCKILNSNNQTLQHYNRTLKLYPPGQEAHAQECVEFARAVAEGGASPVPAEQSLQVLKILDGIYRSHELGGEVRLD